MLQELILFLCSDLTALEFTFRDVPLSLTEPAKVHNVQCHEYKGKIIAKFNSIRTSTTVVTVEFMLLKFF